ncbi:MAG: DUF3048 domain-containing protein [Eubacteriales bacterium]
MDDKKNVNNEQSVNGTDKDSGKQPAVHNTQDIPLPPPSEQIDKQKDQKNGVEDKIKHSAKKLRLFILVAVGILLIIGFIAGGIALGLGGGDKLPVTGTEDATPQPTNAPSTAEVNEATEDIVATKATQPATQSTTEPPTGPAKSLLTGLACSEEDKLKRPAAIMINNIKDAMPNVGIASADIVYECLVEGGQTRLLMIAQNYEKISAIGSVRSSREYYIDFAQIHDALYVHAGGSDEAYRQLKSRKIDRLDGVNMYSPDGTFYRDAQRRKTMALEHTLMTSGTGLVEGFKYYSYRLSHSADYKGTFTFSDEDYTPAGGWNADVVQLAYSFFVPQFTYNKENLKYYREQFGVPHVDGATGEQLSFDNILILFTPHSYTGDDKGHVEVSFTGSGTGYYVTRGVYVKCNWQRDDWNGGLSLTDKDGNVLKLNKGKTFISVFDSGNKKGVRIGTPVK